MHDLHRHDKSGPSPAVPISPYLSVKLRVISLIAVCAVVVVHAYNLNSRLLAGENSPEAPGVPGFVGFVEYLFSQALSRWPAALLFAISGLLFYRNLDFVSQEPILLIVKRGLLKVLGTSDAAVLTAYFLTVGITVALCLAAGWALRAVAPRAFAVLTGRRTAGAAPGG